MKSRRPKQKINDYTRKRREWLRDTSVSTVATRIRRPEKETRLIRGSLGAVTDADLKL